MPLYQYRCKTCFIELEIRHSISEGPGICKDCGKDTLEKQIDFISNITRTSSLSRKEKVGTATNRAIKDEKVDLEKQKKDLENK